MSGSPYFLTSDRLGWRWWAEEDLPLAQRLWGDPQVTQLIGGPFSTPQVQTKLAREIEYAQTHQVQYWPIFLQTNREFIGCCGLRPYNMDMGILELGFHICPSHWKRGYATEGALAVIAHAFDQLAAPELFAGHHPQNQASQRMLTRLGFCHTHHEYYEPTGLMHPSYRLVREGYCPPSNTK